ALGVARLERTREPHAGQAVFLAIAFQLGALFVISVGALILFSHDIGAALWSVSRPFWDVVGGLLEAVLKVAIAPVIWLTELIHAHAHTPHPASPRLQGALPRPNPRRVHPNPATG